jgi:aminoglycoside phosphotransferase family enzyme
MAILALSSDSSRLEMSEQDQVVVYLNTLDGANRNHIETALSHIFLIDNRVYKLKKAVNAGYVDLTTLEKRLECCKSEIALNSRYAPEIYLGVLAVIPEDDSYKLVDIAVPGAVEHAVEYLVLMNRFDANSLLSERLEGGVVTALEMRSLAQKVAKFHQSVGYTGELGTPAITFKVIETTLSVCQEVLHGSSLEQRFLVSAQALRIKLQGVVPDLTKRQDCLVFGHGDLHAKNVCFCNNEYVPFDGIDFSDELACIDRLADIAFLFMDLVRRKHPELAYAFLNEYLEITRDYEHLELFSCFCVHRALIRTLVSWREGKFEAAEEYLEVAEHFLGERLTYVVAVGGLSGTGKTTLNQLFRDWLASLARQRERQTEVAELLNRLQYARAGRKFTREESNEG